VREYVAVWLCGGVGAWMNVHARVVVIYPFLSSSPSPPPSVSVSVSVCSPAFASLPLPVPPMRVHLWRCFLPSD
jgi:hypothetical protein